MVKRLDADSLKHSSIHIHDSIVDDKKNQYDYLFTAQS
ncbi:hypothetical protein RintRC_5416 [Richelia intracellularis]|nr:hypothetical protein RintRC_5416 [Richelia intracellularis]